MATKRTYALMGIICLLVPGFLHGAVSRIDTVELAMREAAPDYLRWDNVEGKPFWQSGERPSYQRSCGFHVISLDPGEYTQCFLPSGQSLRIHYTKPTPSMQSPQLWTSNGSGLFVLQTWETNEEHADLYWRNVSDDPLLYRIEWPETEVETCRFGLFYARKESIKNWTAFLDLVPLSLEPMRVRRSDESASVRYFLLHPGTPVSIESRSGDYLQIESMLFYGETDHRVSRDYRIDFASDNGFSDTLNFYTTAPSRYFYEINGRPALVSERRHAYISLEPDVESFQLTSNETLLIRLLCMAPDDYVFSSANRSKAMPAFEVPVPGWTNPPLGGLVSLPDKLEPFQLPAVLRFIDRLYRVNPGGEGGLSGFAWIQALRQRFQGFSPLSGLTDEARYQRTFFRNLLPAHSIGQVSIETARYPSGTLRLPWDSPLDLKVPLAFSGNRAAASLPSVSLIQCFSPEGDLSFHVPVRTVDSVLRVVVDQGNAQMPSEFSIHFNDHPPIRLKTVPIERSLQDASFQSMAPGYLAALRRYLEDSYGGVFGWPFTASHTTPVFKASYVDLPLPREVHSMRVNADASPVQRSPSFPPQLAFQYLASKPVELKESDFLAVRRSGSVPDRGLLIEATNIHQTPLQSSAASTIVQGDFWSVLRARILSDSSDFTEAVAATPVPLDPRLQSAKIEPEWKQAKDMLHASRPVTALRHLMEIEATSNSELRNQILDAKVRVLTQMGELYQAELCLKGSYLYDPLDMTRQFAFDKLDQLYQNDQDLRKRRLLYSCQYLRTGSSHSLKSLATVYGEQGDYEAALGTLAHLNDEASIPEILYEGALVLEWYQVFDQTLSSEKDPVVRDYWMARKWIRQGLFSDAERLLEGSGGRSAQLLQSLRQEGKILAMLKSDRPTVRTEGFQAWGQWQSELMEEGSWKSMQDGLTCSAGSRWIQSKRTGAFSQYFLATPDAPLQLRSHGPMIYRISARLMHDPGSEDEWDDWITISSSSSQFSHPLNGSLPGNDFHVVGFPEIPGRLYSLQTELIEGKTDLKIEPDSHPVLIQIEQRVPSKGLGLLPLMDDDSWNHFAMMKWNEEAISDDTLNPYVKVESVDTRPRNWKRRKYLKPLQLFQASEWEGGIGGEQPAGGAHLFSSVHPDLGERFTRALWTYEHDRERSNRESAFVKAHEIFSNHPTEESFEEGVSRMMKSRTWERVTNFQGGGGIFFKESDDWQSSNPSLSVRQILMNEKISHPDVIFGNREFVIGTDFDVETDVQVLMKLFTVRFISAAEVSLQLEMDGIPVETFSLHSKPGMQSRNWRVPPGPHLLRLRVMDPPLNHFISLAVETADASFKRFHDPSRLRLDVASHEHPLVIRIEGPAVLRVDEWDTDGLARWRYVYAREMSNVIQIDAGSDIAGVRVFVSRPAEMQPSDEYTQVPLRNLSALSELGNNETESGSAPFEVQDGLDLGKQEDGTWLTGVTLVQRREFEAMRSQGTEQFLEVQVGKKYFWESKSAYSEWGVLGRHHRVGGPVIGATYQLYDERKNSDWNWNAEARTFLQQPYSDWHHLEGSTEWSLLGRASLLKSIELNPKWRLNHILTGFGRALSLQDNSDYPNGELDQDVFSPYKTNHRWGGILGSGLGYTPYRDQTWKASGSLVSNENFLPDSVGAQISVDQAIGVAEIGCFYRLRHFFSDDDRSTALLRQSVGANLEFEQWLKVTHRATIGAEWRYDIELATHNVRLYLRLAFSEGRLFRDYVPGEPNFKTLKSRRPPDKPLNLLNR